MTLTILDTQKKDHTGDGGLANATAASTSAADYGERL
jgi:hypothetical protein